MGWPLPLRLFVRGIRGGVLADNVARYVVGILFQTKGETMNSNRWAWPLRPGSKKRGIDLLPTKDEIPAEFFDGHNEFHKAVQGWMITGVEFGRGKGSIKAAVALEHLRAAYSAFGTDYDRRVAGCAYLLSLWTRPAPAADCSFCHGGPVVAGGTLCDECREACSDDGRAVIRSRGANDAF